MNYKLSREALADLQQVWQYTANHWSVVQADRYLTLIFDRIAYLAANPESGKDFSAIREHYRASKVASHLIFYRKSETEHLIEIIRILHAQMDIMSHLSE